MNVEGVKNLESYGNWIGCVIGLQGGVKVILVEKPEGGGRQRAQLKNDGSAFWIEVYQDNIPDEETLYVILAHELIHLKQIQNGDLVFEGNIAKWVSGRETPKLKHSPHWSVSYLAYRNQPHEREAWHNDRLLYSKWLSMKQQAA